MVAVIFKFLLYLSTLVNGFLAHTPAIEPPGSPCLIEKTVVMPDAPHTPVPPCKPVVS